MVVVDSGVKLAHVECPGLLNVHERGSSIGVRGENGRRVCPGRLHLLLLSQRSEHFSLLIKGEGSLNLLEGGTVLKGYQFLMGGDDLANTVHAHLTTVAVLTEAKIVVLAVETNPVADSFTEASPSSKGELVDVHTLIFLVRSGISCWGLGRSLRRWHEALLV